MAWVRTTPNLSLFSTSLLLLPALLFGEGEGVESVFDWNNEVLAAVELIGHGGSEKLAADVEMPESFAGGGIESEEIPLVVRGEEEMAGGGEDSLQTFAFAEFAIPDDFAGFVIEGTQ